MTNLTLDRSRISTPILPQQLLTVRLALPSLPNAVAPVTQSLGEVTCKRLHWSGVVRRGAVDTTPGFTTTHPTSSRTELLPREPA